MAKMTFRIWVLVIALILALLAISPSFDQGAVIRSIDVNSTAYESGLRQGMIIRGVNSEPVNGIEDYSNAISNAFKTNQSQTKVTVQTETDEFIFLTREVPDITVGDIPRTNIKTGLDLSGGARALIKAENMTLTDSQMSDLIAITNQRINVFGISDVDVRSTRDLEGERFMLIEIAGATPSDLEELISQQGKFEAKVGNVTVFEGGKNDISDVCRNRAECAAITQCSAVQGGYACTFAFTIYLTEEAAKRHAEVTDKLTIDETGQYLSEKLYLYVDDTEVDSLFISVDLKGQQTTEISIQGSGSGTTQEEALIAARESMNKLQTILITGSLPYKLEIVKLDTISPVLGKEFAKNMLMLGLVVFVLVSVVLFVKYKRIKITLAVILTMFSEVVLTLGIAALIRWNLDAPSIAGIIAGIGTGVNDQIVIIDESVSQKSIGVRERIKRALFIITGAFLTIVAAMIPLFWAGAGLLRGFALTTIIGVTVGILITRPAFADIIRKISE